MVPLWKILHLAGVDWTYSCSAWGGENYCMFLAETEQEYLGENLKEVWLPGEPGTPDPLGIR